MKPNLKKNFLPVLESEGMLVLKVERSTTKRYKVIAGGCRQCGCREYVSPTRGTEICVNCGHGKQYH